MRQPVTPPAGTKHYQSDSKTEPSLRCTSGHAYINVKAYLDGELSAPRRWQMRRHLSACVECREEFASLQNLGGIMKELEKATPRPELRARIMASLPDTPEYARPAVQQRMRTAPWRQSVPRYAIGGGLAASLCIGAFALGFSYRQTLRAADASSNAAIALAPATVPNTGNVSNNSSRDSIGDVTPATTSVPTVVADAREQAQNDYVNAETERLYLLKQKVRLLDERRHPAAKPDRGSAARGIPVGSSGGALHPAEIALAVPDLAAARTSLQSLAQQSGGMVLPTTLAAGTSRTHTGEVQMDRKDSTASSSAEETRMLLRIPVSRLTAVRSALGKIGVLQPQSKPPIDKTGRFVPNTFQVYTEDDGGFRGDSAPVTRPNMSVSPANSPSSPRQMRPLMPVPTDADSISKAYVLVFIRLRATPHPPH